MYAIAPMIDCASRLPFSTPRRSRHSCPIAEQSSLPLFEKKNFWMGIGKCPSWCNFNDRLFASNMVVVVLIFASLILSRVGMIPVAIACAFHSGTVTVATVAEAEAEAAASRRSASDIFANLSAVLFAAATAFSSADVYRMLFSAVVKQHGIRTSL